MTPTHKDLVEALREAKKALLQYAHEPNWAVTRPEISPYPDWWLLEGAGYELAKATLSKINPIIKKLEGMTL